MLEKIFKEKNDKRKIENVVVFLIVLIITLIIVNKIISDTDEYEFIENKSVEFVSNIEEETEFGYDMEKEIEEILSKVYGIEEVDVLLTYSNSQEEKEIYPKIEGAILVLKGNLNTEFKTNIIYAIEAVTGLLTHKIQIFEMK